MVGYLDPEFDLVIQRGEVDARSNLASSIMQRTPEWADKEKTVLTLLRVIGPSGLAMVLPPNTPRNRAVGLQLAMRNALNDPGFAVSFRNLVGEDSTPLMPDEL